MSTTTHGKPEKVKGLKSKPCDEGKCGVVPLSAEQQRLKWNATIAAMCLDAIPGIYVGSSTWVDHMNKAVPSGMSHWFAPGVTQPGFFIFTALCVYFPLLALLLRRKIFGVRALGILAVAAFVFPLSIGVTAGGGSFWVQYFGAAVGGVGLTAAQFVEKIVAVQWWALTGEQAKGAGMMGGSVGLWSVAFTLLSASLIDGLGLESAMYILAAVVFAATLVPLWLTFADGLHAPPQAAMDASSNAPARSTSPEFSTIAVLSSLQFWQLLFHFFAIFFFGFGMKALLSPIFQTTYDVTYLQSAYFAAFVLAVYALMRIGLPLLTQRFPLMPVHMVLLASSAALYACCPAIVKHLPICWLIVANSLTGASFAGTSTLRNLLALELYGAKDLANVLPLLEVGVGVGKFAGPVGGYYIFLKDTSGAAVASSTASYNPFFYACAGLAALDLVNVVVLHLRNKEESDSEDESQNDSPSVESESEDESDASIA
ncbi:unnamed protein product [Prorocentrum cordatum]|uniref:ADP,ATP carrier protein n=1 Tax=Prorocentrum cordatum TaxID=2364126 RepID=A0ABN9V7B5_9DINO|nr:unnamed protein product [Polarella glacialis]